jgi:hypothetical protein
MVAMEKAKWFLGKNYWLLGKKQSHETEKVKPKHKLGSRCI